MPQNQASGPQLGSTVYFTVTPGSAPVLGFVTAVANGVATVTTLVGTTLTNYPSAAYDPIALTPNSWRWPEIISGV
jgi:hypothetical protein